MTRSVKITLVIIFALIIVLANVILFIERHRAGERSEAKQYIDSIYNQSRETITFDSIRSVIDQKLVDSILVIRGEITTERLARKRETKRISRETELLRHRIDSIGPINRPDL